MKQLCYILFLLTLPAMVQAKQHTPDSVMHRDGLYVDNLKIYSDTAIWQGATLKLDLFNTCYYLAVSEAQMQTYELALNFRLKQRFYPTLELGYTQGKLGVYDAMWDGRGGWGTVGLDFNGMRKHLQALDAILVGLRVGTAVQQYDLENLKMADSYWKEMSTTGYANQLRTDCWGEIVAGCQVHIYSGLMMGWDIRFKLLFTRTLDKNDTKPYFIPGYGYWDYTQWGIHYYIGWKF